MKPLTLVSVEAKPREGDYRNFLITFDTEAGPVVKTLHWGGVAEKVAKAGRHLELCVRVLKFLREAERDAAFAMDPQNWRQHVGNFWRPMTDKEIELCGAIVCQIEAA